MSHIIVYTAGEPAGIGADIFLKYVSENDCSNVLVIADEKMLAERAEQLKIPFRKNFQIHSVECAAPVVPGKLNPHNSTYVLKTLEIAGKICKENPSTHAWVTGPVQKSVINEAGFAFSGHTDWLKNFAGVPETLMLFANQHLKMALLTTHIPLSEVPKKITAERLKSTLLLLHRELQAKFKIKNPRILVCGLNPHAGENGYLGREEIDIMIPVMETLRQENFSLIGPAPADTAFTDFSLAQCDAVLTMYHDQGLPVLKTLNFFDTVNITLGLPFIRTSVDHGTALDLAGTGKADARNVAAAFRMAGQILRSSYED